MRYDLFKEIEDIRGRSEFKHYGNFESDDPHQYLLDLSRDAGGIYSAAPYVEPPQIKPSIWSKLF